MQRTRWPLLLLAFIIGLVFVFLVPPWQHYDEPNHFEYAWLVAHRPGWPQEGDFDREMRVATLQSMIDHNFFRGMDGDIPPHDVPEPWIGPIPQIGDPPLYYWLAALPLRFFPPLEVTSQLYAARLVSLLLFLGTVYLAWETTRLLVAKDSPLRWMVPAFVVALPAFVDIMTAVNNDVAAVAAFMLFIYAATFLIMRGWRWTHIFLLLLAAGLCILSKRTVFFTVVLIPIVLLFTILQGKKQRWAWLILAVIGVLAFAASFRYGDAAAWYRRTPQQALTRFTAEDLHSSAAFRLQIENNDPSYQLVQFLPTESVPKLAGQTVTLGAWIWSEGSVNLRAPRIVLVGKNAPVLLQGDQQITLQRTPHFYRWTFRLPEDPGERAWIQFGPAAENPASPTEVFLDDFVLVIGDFSGAEIPRWQDDSRQYGDWAGKSVENLLRGGSAESAWINPRPWADQAWSRVFGYSSQRWASFILYTLRDWPGTGWYYRATGATLFRSFWAVFGWGHVDLLGSKPYRLLLVVTFILVLGGIWRLWKARRSLRWPVLAVYTLALAVIWGLTLVRGVHHLLMSWLWIPAARYAFPVLLPIAFLFALGANTWQNALARIFRPLHRLPGLLWGVFLGGILIWSWLSIYTFYY
jgi:hypothetical protein